MVKSNVLKFEKIWLSGTLIIIQKPKVWRPDGHEDPYLVERGYKKYRKKYMIYPHVIRFVCDSQKVSIVCTSSFSQLQWGFFTDLWTLRTNSCLLVCFYIYSTIFTFHQWWFVFVIFTSGIWIVSWWRVRSQNRSHVLVPLTSIGIGVTVTLLTIIKLCKLTVNKFSIKKKILYLTFLYEDIIIL